LRNFVIALGVVAVIVAGLWLWNRHTSTFHPNANAVQACRELQSGYSDPSSAGHSFDQASGLAQAAANDDSLYAGFAGEVEVADKLVQQAISSPPLDATDAATFTYAMNVLQTDCESDSGVNLGVKKS
jgi:hypothetical protein